MDEGIKRLIELGVNSDPAVKELKKISDAAAQSGESLAGIQTSLAGLGAGIAGAFAGTQIIGIIKDITSAVGGMIDSMDQLGKSAQQIGTTVEKVQELQYALSFSGIKGDETVQVLGRFSDKIADIGTSSSAAAKKLQAMGVVAGDDAATALGKVADVFSSMPDGVQKTSAAIDIFGKTMGLRMIPALNAGSEGLQQLMDDQSQYGQTSTESAQLASEFNDNLTQLSEAAASIGKSLVNELLPPLVAFTKWCVDMVGPITTSIKWFNKLTSTLSYGAQIARIYNAVMGETVKTQGSLAIGATDVGKGLLSSVDAFLKAGQASTKAGTSIDEINTYLKGVKASADKLASTPERIAAVKQAIAALGKDADPLALRAYNKELENLNKQLEGPTAKGSTRVSKAQKSDMDLWLESLQKAQAQIELVPQKIAVLEKALADLNARGLGNSAWAEKLQADLDKLRADPVADALAKINKAARDLDEAPGFISAMVAQLEAMEKAGNGATNSAKLLREEILKMRAAGGDAVAAVTLELEKQTKANKENADQWEVYEQLFAAGEITLEQYSDGIAKHIGKVHTAMSTTIETTKSLGQAVEEMGAKFVTDFVDKMIDGMGDAQTSFSDMIADMIKQLAKLIVQMQLAKALKDLGNAGGIGALFSGSATGNAWDASGVEYMATGGILSGPTFFRNQGRLAVAGEAGPEAVLPLRRGASGDLGVSASPVTVNVHNENGSEVATTSKDNEDGSRQIDIYITTKVKQMMSDGTLDRSMRNSYGVTRRAAAGT